MRTTRRTLRGRCGTAVLVLATAWVVAGCHDADRDGTNARTPLPTGPPASISTDPASSPYFGTDDEQEACRQVDYSDPAQGALSFSDEFDGTTLDRSVWRARDRTHLDFDQAQIRRENVSLRDGMMVITGRKLPESEWITTPSSRFEWNRVRDYSTGYVDGIKHAGYGNEASEDRFSQRYGYFEIRAKVPSESTRSRGVWPAFWLRADDSLGEIDVMEAYGGPTTRSFDPSSFYYWNSWEDTSQRSSKDQLLREVAAPDGEPIWQDFHTYGVHWSPTCLRYTFDGQTVGIVPLRVKDYFTGPTFLTPFHVRLNMQIGSNYWGKADDAHTRPQFEYLIDYVRVYQGHLRF